MKKIIIAALAAVMLMGCNASSDDETQPTGTLEEGKMPGFGTYKIVAEKVTANGYDIYMLSATVSSSDKDEGYGIIFSDTDGLNNSVLMVRYADSSKASLYDTITIITDDMAVIRSSVRGSIEYVEEKYEYAGEFTVSEASKKQLQSAKTLHVVLTKNDAIAAEFDLPLALKKYMKHVI
ncbi:MAG: hypothetical protein HDR37_08035 [Treponema sp.]|nr:hypothetical protein [Treponema sp.]